MTDYTNLLDRLAVSAGDQECLYADAKAAIEALQSRVAYLESRLEVAPEHDIDGIAARDATIKLQDGRIAELKSRLAESEDTNKALRVRLGSVLERANELVADLQAERSFLLAERAEREKQEPIATVGWDRNFMGVVWHGKNMPEKGVETLLYAAPPVITQHEPVTTIEDRYNADGKSCHITDDLPAGMPLYAAHPVAAPVRMTDGDMLDSLNETAIAKQAACGYPSMRNLLDLARAIETGVLRANGFKVEGEQ